MQKFRACWHGLHQRILVTDAERVAELGATDDVKAASTQSFLDDTQHDQGIEDPWAMDPEDIAVLLFTSGTTGEPKAAGA